MLVGLPGAGKSSVGRVLSRRLRLPFVDLDAEIERRAGTSIAAMFAAPGGGEERFRELELEATRDLAAAVSRAVVAPGGGWMMNSRALALLRPLSLIVHLRVSAESALERLGTAAIDRPLLSGEGPKRLGALRALLQRRESMYRSADFVVDTELLDIQEVADEVVRLIGAAWGRQA